MAAIHSAKAGKQRHGRGGSGRRSGGSSPAPLGVGRNKQQPNLPSQVSAWESLSRFSDLTLVAFLAVAAALPYLNTLRNGLVSDDGMQVEHNPYIRSFHYLAKVFTTQATSHGQGWPNYYRPLMNVGYLLCYQVFGPRAFGFHLASVVLNGAVVCAVFLLTKRMSQDRNLALMAAVLFAIYPVHSEAIAWIAASPDLELGIFYLLTFWLFLEEARPGGRFSPIAQLAMAGSFVLALFSKEQAVTLPVLATVYEHFYRADREETRPAQKVWRYAVLWFLTVAYLLFRVRVLGRLSSGFSVQHLTWYGTFVSAIALLGQYLWKVLWPVDLRVFCPFHVPRSLLDPPVVGGLTALAAGSALLFFLWRRAKPLSFGLLQMLATLAPVLNVRWMPVAAFEERYLYLPSVGFCWLLGWAFLRLWVKASARGAIWSRALGIAYEKTGQHGPAETEFRTALSLSPRQDSQAHFKLGALYLDQGRRAEALKEYQAGLKSDPEDRDALAAVQKLSSHVGDK